MSKAPRITSHFALLDVEKGRKALLKHIAKHGPVPVTIHGVIDCAWGGDDGTSIEFSCDVQSAVLGEHPIPHQDRIGGET